MATDFWDFRNKKVITSFIVLCLLTVLLIPNAFAKRSIVLTYDISASMFYLSKKGDNIAFLTAGEFDRLASSVADQIFYGNAFQNSHDVIVNNDENMGPYWHEGDGFYYIEYGESSNPKIGYDGGQLSTIESLRQRLLDVIAYPRKIPSGSKNLGKSHIKKAFYKAFPDKASLQSLSDISVWEIFDNMIKNGDESAEVIWIKVSDEDRDHTTVKGGPSYVKEENKQEKKIQEYLRTYKNCMPRPIFQIKYCDRVWVTAKIIKYFDVSDLENSLEEAQVAAQNSKIELERLRAQLKQDQNLSAQQLQDIQDEAEKAKEQARLSEEKARKLKQDLDQRIEANEIAIRDIHLQLVDNKNDIRNQKIQFARKKIETMDQKSKKPFVFNKFVLQNGKKSIASEFTINSLEFEIRDRNGTSLFHSSNGHVVDETIEIGKPFTIVVPYNDTIAEQGRSVYIDVTYQFLSDASGNLNKKNWTIKATFPGTSSLFLWIFLLILLISGVIVIFVMKMKSSGHALGYSPHKSNDDDAHLWGNDDDSGVPSYRDDLDDDIHSLSDTQTTIIFTVKGMGQKELIVEDDETIYLSLPDDSRAQYIDINSSGTLQWQNGMILYNGIPATKNKLVVKDNFGRKQVITWKII